MDHGDFAWIIEPPIAILSRTSIPPQSVMNCSMNYNVLLILRTGFEVQFSPNSDMTVGHTKYLFPITRGSLGDLGDALRINQRVGNVPSNRDRGIFHLTFVNVLVFFDDILVYTITRKSLWVI